MTLRTSKVLAAHHLYELGDDESVLLQYVSHG